MPELHQRDMPRVQFTLTNTRPNGGRSPVTTPTLNPNDIVHVKGDTTPNYNATIEAINGDRITVRPLPNQEATTRARAVNRAAILNTVTKAKPQAVESAKTTFVGHLCCAACGKAFAIGETADISGVDHKVYHYACKPPETKPAPPETSAPLPNDDIAELRTDVARALATNFPEAQQAWRNGWRAACTYILKQIDKRDAASKQPDADEPVSETNGIAAE
jgi:hypothetical protein